MKKIQLKKLIALFVIAFTFSSLNFVQAAKNYGDYVSDDALFYFVPDQSSILDADYLYIDVNIDPADHLINATGIEVNYDHNYIQLESADYSYSFCNLFLPGKPDDSTGYFYSACGSPRATSSAANIVKLKFKKIRSGLTKILFGETQALLHDGHGTPMDTTNETLYLEIIK